MIEEYVINNRSNSIDLLLTANGIAQSLSTVTKMILVDDAGDLDDISSVDHPTWFNWSTSTTGKVIIKLGSAGLTTGEKYIFKLIVYDPGNTLGIEWDKFIVYVR